MIEDGIGLRFLEGGGSERMAGIECIMFYAVDGFGNLELGPFLTCLCL
jgi:hypothetical protein